MIRASLLAAIFAAPVVPAAHAASDYHTENRLTINQIDADSFEIIEARGFGGWQFWCAAGRYVKRGLGQSRGHLFVESPRGPAKTQPGSIGIVFTTKPVDNPVRAQSVSVNLVGQTMSIGKAADFCQNYNPSSF